jgi:flagellar M-ring protein FliF
MPESLRQLFETLGALPPARQLALALATAGSLAFFGWIATTAAEPKFRPLYRGLDPEQASQVVDGLDAEKIPYRLDEGGSAVLVPDARLHEARIQLAGRGLPNGAGAGFELFDQPAFGVADFVQHVNYVRAIQGELARTIEHLDPVERARVQVAIPERSSLLGRAELEPRASVIVRLRPGRTLAEDQVAAVVHLVASSVERLDPKRVTVVDGAGRLLAPQQDSEPALAGVAGATAYQQRIESELARRVEGILEKTVGPGNVIARVRAQLDWTESETTEELFDPESQVARSEQRSEESSGETEPVGGAPGLVANSPDALGAVPAGEPVPGATRNSETINYEISKTVVRKVVPMGRVERLSIAVLVADRKAPEGEGVVPWEAPALDGFAKLARQAVGFDEKRGDQIEVSSAPFRLPEEEALPEGGPDWRTWLPLAESLARGVALLVALLVFARLVAQPLLRALAVPPEGGRAPGGALAAGSAGEPAALSAGQGPELAALPPPRQQQRPIATEGARALREWLSQG